jgi:hypothetical protein
MKNKFSLPYVPTTISDVTVPANTKMWTAPQGLDTCVRIDGSLT